MKPEFINHLHVEGVGPFDRLDVEFSPDVNVIIGVNGSGKTSILRSITHCFTNENRNYFRYRKDGFLWTYFMRGNNQHRCGGMPFGLEEDQHYQQRLNPLYARLPEEDGVITHQAYNSPYNILAIGAHRYFDYVRVSGMIKEENSGNQREEYAKMNPIYIDRPMLPNIKQWMINRYFIIEKSWGKDLKYNWEKIMEAIPILSLPNHKLQFLRIEEDLEPIFSVDDRECYLEELSSGFKSVLSLIFSIVNWIEGVNDGEKRLMDNATGTVLIDELETHLHPAWQKTILKTITQIFPSLQFIVTTHSPYVIASVSKGQVIMLPSISSDLKLRPTDQDYSGWRQEYIMRDLMGTDEIVSPELGNIISELNTSLNDKNKEHFQTAFSHLQTVLNGSDSMLLNYELRGAEVFGEL